MHVNSHTLDKTREGIGLRVRDIGHQNAYDFKVLHRHEYYELILFDNANDGRQTIDFEEYKIEAQSLYIIAPNQLHLMNRKAEENGILIQFTRDFLKYCITPLNAEFLFLLNVCSKVNLSSGQYTNIRNLFVQLQNELLENGSYKRQKINYLFGYLFFKIIEALPKGANIYREHDCASDFLYLVSDRFAELKSVQEYAQLLKVPVNRLTQKVKSRFGKSPLQIMHEFVLTEIKRLMVTGKYSHKEIAYKCGFDSQSSYTRFIRQKTRFTPSDLSKQLSQIES